MQQNPGAAAHDIAANAAAQAFIQRWQGNALSELATSQSFVNELCVLLGVEPPAHEPHYQFERPITFHHGDGSTSAGRVDCYKRGHFVWESKKLKAGVQAQKVGSTTKAFDDALLRARQQAEDYARALPASEGRPPFVVVVDVGHVIELYAEFTRSGATYTPFPDPRSHRIRLAQLAEPSIRARLTALWTDPLSLDPSRVSAKVTRAVAAELADLAKSLEASGHAPQRVAAFLTRCLFSMFAEDVGLLPAGPGGVGSFVHLLTTYREQPHTLSQMLKVFWASMDTGGFNAAIAQDVLRFNGKLFKGAAADGYALPLTAPQIDGLLRAAQANWQEVEPAIFGTLLERALDPQERHALGAHYTPRAYVERLVMPTVVEPLRSDWANAQTAAFVLLREADELRANPPKRKSGTTHDTFDPRQLAKETKALVEHERKIREKEQAALQEIKRFHHQLCKVRVLDPACGSGNFLYVTLEHLKRLEGEVLNRLAELGQATDVFTEAETVTLKQCLGIELNPRAAALAELVLWIGWLQWHVRTRGPGSVAEPVVHDYGNIECRDAVLAYDRVEPALDEQGHTLTRWDGETYKKHPVTGEDVPDESAVVLQYAYINPRQALWPEAEFIVGNPPFIGNKRMRDALGDGYSEALRGVWREVPDTADFVMYWWHHAALAMKQGLARRFGFITTNSITQIFNRRVIEQAGVSLAFAIADHPWVDGADGAAVRVAMTVGVSEALNEGQLVTVIEEAPGGGDTPSVKYGSRSGLIHPNLTVGANVLSCVRLSANLGLSFMGMIPLGAGFWIDDETADRIGRRTVPSLGRHIRRYRNGKDLTDRARGLLALDFFGLSEEEVRANFPAAYQWIIERVKPQRDQDNRESRRRNWWLFAESVPKFRVATQGLARYIGTTETAKHRLFSFLEADILPDQKIRSVASDDAFVLGVLSSAIHTIWAPRAGGKMGVGNDPVYNNTRCFEPFPFPSDDTGLTPALTERIRQLAEQLDAHRKARQAAHESVTLTGLYNVLDKLRRAEALNAKEKLLHEQGLVSVLHSLHEELDAAVLQAYGWADLGPVPWADEAARSTWTETLLTRLVALNAQRAAEEAAGTIRWLRPEFQDPARRAAAAAAAAAASASTATGPTPPPTQPAQQVGLEGITTQAEARAAQAEQDAATAAADAAAANAEGDEAAPASPSPAAQAWPSTLPEQVRAVAQLLSTSPTPLPLPAIEASFKGKGPWKKGLPRILDTLEALGRARLEGSGWRG